MMPELAPLESLQIPQEELDALQLTRLRRSLRVIADNHPYYQHTLKNLDFEAWTSLDDIDAIPVTTKSDIASDPEAFRLRDTNGDPHLLWDVIYTSGTTSRPIPIYQSPHDYRRILFSQRRMSEIRGTTSTDTIANLFPLAARPNGSWLRINDHAIAIGAKLVAGLGGPTTGRFTPTRRLGDVARIVADSDPTVLWGIGSYLRRFIAACRAEGHRLPSVRMVIASGEAMTPSISASILDGLRDLGATNPAMSPGFGASELQCSLVPCEDGSGLHNPAPELFLLQTTDEGGRTLPAGAKGRLTLTHLDRTGTVLIRYALGDEVTLERGRCPTCGRAGERLIAHHGRGDTMQKIRGQLVDLSVVNSIVAAERDAAEYAIEVVPADPEEPSTMDVLRIRIVLEKGADAATLTEHIHRKVSEAVSVRPVIEPSTPDGLYQSESVTKPKRREVGS